MEYRKHWLINSLGNRYDFTEKAIKTFLHEPKGFGFQRSFSSIRLGNSELITSQQITLTDISGDLLFYDGGLGSKYEDYQEFIQFCKFTPLEFHYQTPNELTSYHCDVIFTQADKSEVSANDKILHVPVTFHRLTEWLTDDDFAIGLTNDDIGKGKQYPLKRTYHYAANNMSNNPIYNNGTDDVGFILKVDGGVINPQFTLSQNGIVYGCCRLNVTCDYLLLDSLELEESLYIENNGSVLANPEQYQDFSLISNYPSANLTWCKLKVGESIFSFTCGNASTAEGGLNKFDGLVSIIFKSSYISV